MSLAQPVCAGHRYGTSSFRWWRPLDVVIRTIVRYAPNTATAVVTMRREAVIAVERVDTLISVAPANSGNSTRTSTTSAVPSCPVSTRDRYAIACPAHHQPNAAR